MSLKVLLIGATGLVGNLSLVKLLHHDQIGEVRIITRRESGIVHEKLKELVIDFEKLGEYKSFMQCDILISCLGSTMKKAGSRKAFERFDYYYPKEIAEICRMNGCRKMILLSAFGADKKYSFYTRVKGRLERECAKTGFESLIIIQPSLIIGTRTEKRFGEKMAKYIMGFFSPMMPSKLKSVTAETLAGTILWHAINKSHKPLDIIQYKDFVQ